MASTYTTNLRVEKPAYNEQSDTWGTTLDTGFDRFDGSLGGVIYGLGLSTAGSSATFGIAAGGASGMTLASAYTKTTSSWALGTAAGALDTGAIANSTWYHVWLIERVDTSPTVTDVLVSLSATAPTMPTNYTRKRRIGSMKTNGSAQWAPFRQYGDYFYWEAEVTDASSAVPGSTNNFNVTMTVPPGFNTVPIFIFRGSATAGSVFMYAADGGQSAATSWPLLASAGADVYVPVSSLMTDTSARLVFRASSITSAYTVITKGWIDSRGR